MSKLPKAPLLEVIFEINWDVINNQDIVRSQFLHGDLYSVLKTDYPIRENLFPTEVPFDIMKNLVMFRFRKKSGYPLVQIGPGILTLNTTDETYYWDKFSEEISRVTKSLSDVLPEINQTNLFLSLTYLDFFEINDENLNLIEFINKNFNLNINQTFTENPITNEINLTFTYKINENNLILNLRNGIINNNEKGLVLQTKLVSLKKKYTSVEQLIWLNYAHEICSDIFKKIINPCFYETFK